MNWFYNQPVNIFFGNNCYENLPGLVGKRKTLLVTSPYFSREGIAKKISERLENCIIFDKVSPNPDVSVISDRENGKKIPVASDSFYPEYALIDPVLTYSLPPHIMAVSGIDVLCHAIEGYIRRNHQPICDALTLDYFLKVNKSDDRTLKLAKELGYENVDVFADRIHT